MFESTKVGMSNTLFLISNKHFFSACFPNEDLRDPHKTSAVFYAHGWWDAMSSGYKIRTHYLVAYSSLYGNRNVL